MTVKEFIKKHNIPESKVYLGIPDSDDICKYEEGPEYHNLQVEYCFQENGIYLIEVNPW